LEFERKRRRMKMRRKIVKINSEAKSKIIILITLGILLALLPIITNNLRFTTGKSNESSDYSDDISLDNENLKLSKISEKIAISDNSGWANAETTGICTGSGTSNDPYIIEDLEIDGGGSGSCILIEGSTVYFRIENCTIYNSGVDWGDGGIKLYNVDNGQLLNNSVSLCGYEGIILEFSDDNIIFGNIANTNPYLGIGLWYSDGNVISENTFRYNGWGISLDSSHNNNITGNNANNNKDDGIGIWNSNNNFVSENNINDNNRGLFLYHSDNNGISGNSINRNLVGMVIEISDSNIIIENTISVNTIGIEIIRSKCNDISNNTLSVNAKNISGTQDECVSPPSTINRFLIEYVLIFGIIVASTIFLMVMLKSPAEKPIEEFKIEKTPIRENGIEAEITSKLIIPIEVKKLDVIQEEIIPSSPKEMPVKGEVVEEEIIVEVPKIQIINCQFCGKELSSDMIFCLQCGHKLNK